MPLFSQNFPLPFASGVDEKTDPRWVVPGKHTSLINGHLSRAGSIRKRNGFGVLGGVGAYTALSAWGRALSADTFQRAIATSTGLAMVNGDRLWALSPSTKTLVDLDDVTPIDAARFPIDSVSEAIVSYDVATLGDGRTVVAYVESSALHVVVLDGASRVISTTAANCNHAKFVFTSALTATQALIVSEASNLAQTLELLLFDAATGAITTIGSIVADLRGTSYWDACTFDGAAQTNFVVAHATAAGWTIALVNAAGVTTASSAQVPAGATPLVCNVAVRATAGEQVWVAHQEITGGGAAVPLRIMGFRPDLGAITTPDTQLDSRVADHDASIGIERIDATHAIVVWSIFPTFGCSTSWIVVTTGGGFSTTGTAQNTKLASAPFTLGGRIYAQLLFSSSSPNEPALDASGSGGQPDLTAYLVELQTGDAEFRAAQLRAVVAPRIVPNSAFSSPIDIRQVSRVAVSGNRAIAPVPVIRSGTDPNGLDVAMYTRGYTLHQPASIGASIALSGGVPCIFDGARVTELGFAFTPASITLTQGAGGSMADGTYVYAFVWEWHDATGARKQSQPVYQSITVAGGGGNASVSISAPKLSLTLCQDEESDFLPSIYLAIYRTIPSEVAGIFVRVAPAAPGDTATPSEWASDPTGGTITYVDGALDSNIVGNEELYTNGGVLSGQIPSALSSIITHNGRLFGIGDDGATLWYSTAWDGGTTQPRFNDSLTIAIAGTGRITALASMDGNLIVFTTRAIYVISGDGPDETGAGASWSLPPREIPSDVGCDADWRAVTVTPMGVVFQSGTRLYLLSRSLEVRYFSRAVEQTLASFHVVTSMALVPEQEQLRITCREADGSAAGRILVYDYVGDAWSVYSTFDSDSATAGSGTDSACKTALGYVWLGAHGSLWFEQPTSYLDPGATWVTLSVESANMKPADVLGFVRFRWVELGVEKNTDADLTLAVAMDYEDTYSQSATMSAQRLNAATTRKPMVKLHVANQKAASMRVKVSDAAPTGGVVGTGQGYTFFGLTIEGGVKKGLRKLPQMQGV